MLASCGQFKVCVLRALRSTGVAYARGSNFDKALKRRGLDKQLAPVVVRALIEDAIARLEGLKMLCR
jgi:hypothetical protein